MKHASWLVLSCSMMATGACSKSSDAPARYGTNADTQGNLVSVPLDPPRSGNTLPPINTASPSNPRTTKPAIGGGPSPQRSEALDVDEGALSSQKAGSRDADRALAAKIRQSLLADRSLSGLARSIDIATSGGTVTLRGVVSTMTEKSTIEAKARDAAGPSRVFNLLEVSSQ
jgi:hypothetical protein